tara:strand:+ start:2755 stop:3705 length:951 start_codon:yes stop_codon:yes gene_type:complete
MNKFCVIGLGEHAKTKIIPAIRTLKNVTLAAIAKREDFEDTDILIFNSLDQAITKLDKDFVFYVSTPPSTHYELATNLLKKDFNCLIEKPIFLNLNQFLEVKKIALDRSKFFYECFMYRYGKIYSEFLDIYFRNKEKIKSLEIQFCIPDIPPNTFRSTQNISSSLIYDIGCYPISLINDIGKSKEIELVSIENYGNYNKEKFNIQGKMDEINLNIIFGINQSYENYVLINFNDNNRIKFEYFFYGRKIDKKIIIKKNDIDEIKIINDGNLFEEMLHNVNNNLYKNQEIRNFEIERNILDLELLISQYKSFNSNETK